MSGERTPLFVDRRSYRRRRLADAARLLPILGAVVFFLPLVWHGSDGSEGASTALVMAYLFGGWALLALAAGLLSSHLHDSADTPVGADSDNETASASADTADHTTDRTGAG